MSYVQKLTTFLFNTMWRLSCSVIAALFSLAIQISLQAFQESIEHQTNASLGIIDSQDDLLKRLTESYKLSHETNREDLAWDQVAKNQVS